MSKTLKDNHYFEAIYFARLDPASARHEVTSAIRRRHARRDRKAARLALRQDYVPA
jgi:hypothetical protein